MFDNACIDGCKKGNWLARSAEELRQTVQPSLSCEQTNIDRDIVSVFEENGPVYRNEATVIASKLHRRVGYTYYNKQFAELMMQEVLMHSGRIKPACNRLCFTFCQRGSVLASLMLTNGRDWIKLIEDITYSTFVQNMKKIVTRMLCP